MNTKRVVEMLDAIDSTDPDVAREQALRALIAYQPKKVREAYQRLTERSAR